MATVKKKVTKKKTAKKKAVVRTRVNKKKLPLKKKDKNGSDRGAKKKILSKPMLKQLEATAAFGGTYHEMAMSIGVCRDTLTRCRAEQSGVQELIDSAKARGCVVLKNRAYQVATVPVGKFKAVNWSALQYMLNNNTEFSTQLELSEGQGIPNDVDINDEEAVATYLNMIKKPS